MKRSILISILVVVLLMVSSIVAQDTAIRPIKYGIKAGVGMANITGADKEGIITDSVGIDVTTKSLLGFDFGLWLRYDLSPNLAIQPEVLYVMKGTKYETSIGDAKGHLNYIQVPVLLKYMFPTKGKMMPNIFAGPFLGFLMSAKIKGDGGEVDIKDAMKSTEFGATFGAGIDVAAGATGVFTIDARYDLGLSKIPKKDDVSGIQPNVKTSNICLFLGYGF